MSIDTSKKKIPEAIVQAYGIIVTLSEKNEIVALKVAPGEDSLFLRIKNTQEARIEETEVSPDALLPDGPYDLWHEGDTARRVNDLVGAFAAAPAPAQDAQQARDPRDAPGRLPERPVRPAA